MKSKHHYDWLIVGGGLHSIHCAIKILHENRAYPIKLGIVDPGDGLMACWNARTAATGMKHLRSPGVHHLGVEPMDLHKFAGKRTRYRKGLFQAPYDRPSLHLFSQHCERLIQDYDLESLQIKDKVTNISIHEDGIQLTCEGLERLECDRCILAIGHGDHLDKPGWSEASTDITVRHIFEDKFRWDDLNLESSKRMLVIGGGITAVQAALHGIERGHEVTLLSRHPFREHQFDSDPGWLGPKYMTSFSNTTDYTHRRQMIVRARHRGSVPATLIQTCRGLVQRNELSYVQGSIEELGDRRQVVLENGQQLDTDFILLATGFGRKRPGGSMVDELIERYQLPTSDCGYPIVDQELRWHPRVHVTGALAELELGPSSRNIAGARRAAERIVKVC